MGTAIKTVNIVRQNMPDKNAVNFFADIPAHAIEARPCASNTKEAGYLFACLAQYTSSILTRNCRSAEDKDLVENEIECIQRKSARMLRIG